MPPLSNSLASFFFFQLWLEYRSCLRISAGRMSAGQVVASPPYPLDKYPPHTHPHIRVGIHYVDTRIYF